MQSWSEYLRKDTISALGGAKGSAGASSAAPEERKFNFGTNCYIIRNPDKSALLAAYPAIIRKENLPDIFYECPQGYAGAAGCFIEMIKSRVRGDDRLKPLGGLTTKMPENFSANIEPVTFCGADEGTGSSLWRAGTSNYIDEKGLHLQIQAAFPYEEPSPSALRKITESFTGINEAVYECAGKCGGEWRRSIENAALTAADQDAVRERLFGMNLTAFIADGTKPARQYTKHRAQFRTAGPAPVNIPYEFPENTSPIEIELPFSGKTITGLGIRRREVFAISGSNAEGKSTFLRTVISGQDTHLPGDGREYCITQRGTASAESFEGDISGSDISLFFKELPKGCSGTTKSVCGCGSGSMGMAAQISHAMIKQAPAVIIDEDKAATNLLVPNCMQKGNVTPLSEILKNSRDSLGDMTIIFAAATMDLLLLQADRIIRFDDRKIAGTDKKDFSEAYLKYIDRIRKTLTEYLNQEGRK